MSKRIKRDWHPKFKEYMKFIVEHPNYKGMPFLYKKDGGIRWIVTRGSEAGQARLQWWNNKRKELGFSKDTRISKIVRTIHPTGEKPCQICGKVMSLDYIYPNKKGTKSPGAMSDAPDRLEGYHTYNLCCRGKQDTGRHQSNLARYGEDRRAYETWSEGDWKAASWLMKEFQKHKVSPDHLGPISLGFMHRPNFRPLTSAENSARGNRMTYEDVQLLIKDERISPVISSHSKFIWDILKNKVKNNNDALKLSKLMRENIHCILGIFSYLSDKGYKEFLTKNFLYPEYADYSIGFEGFDPKTGSYTKMIKIKGDKKQYLNNAKRYIRIALESLKEYSLKKNRHLKSFLTKDVQENLDSVIDALKQKNEKIALSKLYKTFEIIAKNLGKDF
jgi:hypothetical protein